MPQAAVTCRGFYLGMRIPSDEQRWSDADTEYFYNDGEATAEDGIVSHYLVVRTA